MEGVISTEDKTKSLTILFKQHLDLDLRYSKGEILGDQAKRWNQKVIGLKLRHEV